MHVPDEDGPWGRPFWPNSPEGKAAVSISVALSIVKVWVEVKVLFFRTDFDFAEIFGQSDTRLAFARANSKLAPNLFSNGGYPGGADNRTCPTSHRGRQQHLLL